MLAAAGLAMGMVAAAALGWFVLQDPATITLEATSPGVESFVIADGTTDLAGLRQAAVRLGRPDAVTLEGSSTYLLSVPVTVTPSGALEISGVQVRLRSTAEGFIGIEARGGAITIDRSTVTSWDPATAGPDANLVDGRSYVLARDGGRMDVTGSVAEMLGYEADDRQGMSWRMPGTRGHIHQSRFTANFYGAYLASTEPVEITNSVFERSTVDGLAPHSGSRNFVITGNIFRDNGRNGALLAVDCTGATITDNEAYANREDGIGLATGSDRAVLVSNESHDNDDAGISIGGSTGVAVRDNDVWSNTVGVTVQDGAQQAVIDTNRVSSNRIDGVLVTSEGSTVTVSGNRIDHNGRAGVWVSDGQVAVGPANTITKNEAAVRMADETPQVEIFDNLLEDNFKDGVNLGVPTGVRVTGNRILDNDAAFSVRTAGDAAPYLPNNTIENNRLGAERVREPELAV